MKKTLVYIGCVLLAFVPALAGMITRPDDWYQHLNKPPLQPPPWVFAPVWTFLYLAMGISYALYCTTPSPAGKKAGHAFYLIQLVLNGAWSLLFFGAHLPLIAGIDLLALVLFVVLTISAFSKVSAGAGRLLYPYLAWISFASYLNWGVVWLNRG